MSVSSSIFFVCISILLISSVELAPAKYISKSAEKNCSDSENDENEDFHDIIDQSQNGTENYRISLKDFVFVWAPRDILLTAAALFDSQLFGSNMFESEGNAESTTPLEIEDKPPSKNTTESTTNDEVTINSAQVSPFKRSKLRFPSLVAPMLKKSSINLN
ncbi:hypothetical protein FQA39_LY00993 [Lamprigera yunnana]|nr:hypothetical protein FQA39_LY00993 [Lamprigera yunnana]